MSEVILNTLSIIDLEIKRLMNKASASGLDLSETKQLEILIKTRQLLIGEPTEITTTTQSCEGSIADKDILEVLKPQQGAGNGEIKKKANKKSKKTAP
jgi:hypothetical protein